MGVVAYLKVRPAKEPQCRPLSRSCPAAASSEGCAVVKCPFKATVLREGPAQHAGTGAAWLA
ncbi:hypothetical protein GCM10010236_09160 [Streptomyces eurythermus]|nr:hypothetical protein GCM10010236_09160 [Streptomyces eurythermus]